MIYTSKHGKKLVSTLGIALACIANSDALANATGRTLTGYECARMERLVGPMAEVLGMRGEDRFDVVLRWETTSDVPDAVNALMRFLDGYTDETLLRSQHDLKLRFAKDCKAGRIKVLTDKDPKTWTGYDSRKLKR